MQFLNILCCLILMAAVSTSSTEALDKNQDELKSSQSERRISKREATILIGGYPMESNVVYHKPKVIYRRISQAPVHIPFPIHRYKSKPWSKGHKHSKLSRKPGKKYRNYKTKNLSSKYAPPHMPMHLRDPKPMYGPPLKSKRNPPSRGKGKIPHGVENMGFGEPPNDYLPPKQSYGEPPVDSYGAPLKLNSIKPTASHNHQESKKNYNNLYPSENDHKPGYPSLTYNDDNSVAYSKKHQFYTKPDSDEVFASNDKDYTDDFEEMYEANLFKKNKYKKQKPHHSADSGKVKSKPWKRPNAEFKIPEREIDVIVGGQYAEPPARYVPRFQPSAPMFDEDENTFLPVRDDINDDILTSVTVSPYVNYKNSNIAFSPQNLNDAFSSLK